MLQIPEKEARKIAEKYGYDQVIISAIKVGPDVTAQPKGGCTVAYGATPKHQIVVNRIADFLRQKVFGML